METKGFMGGEGVSLVIIGGSAPESRASMTKVVPYFIEPAAIFRAGDQF